jgi:polyphosphate:AMP phosphotransferase
MFETAELGRKVSKEEYRKVEPELRTELVLLQQQLRQADFPVLILFSGVDGAGKGATVNLLNEWMDPRWMETRAYGELSDEERDRPPFWRYWRDLPPRGTVGLFLSAWYSRPLLDRVYQTIDDAVFNERLERILGFEKLLADDGALILKFWMHLGKKAQHRRLKALENDPLQSWRVTPADWEHYEMYDGFVGAAEHLIMRTSQPHAPWKIVEGEDARYRSLTVASIVRDAVRRRLAERRTATEIGPAADLDQGMMADALKTARRTTVLDGLDMTKSVSGKVYDERLPEAQARLNTLYRAAREQGRSMVLVFEGWDAAGKGGVIRRMTAAMDARDYRVIPIAAPTDEENARNYLWRFWRHLGRAGRVTIYDRSWYGRVLVERVEKFASEGEWRRAYTEINDFERQLTESGIIIAKFWVHITQEEQLARFERRQQIPFKAWKLTDEDWRNREKWSEYEQAVHEMVERTSTVIAPWRLIEGNSKKYARLRVIDTVCDALEARLDLQG